MATLSDGFKDIFLAGIGAMAITGEKTKDLVDQLIRRKTWLQACATTCWRLAWPP